MIGFILWFVRWVVGLILFNNSSCGFVMVFVDKSILFCVLCVVSFVVWNILFVFWKIILFVFGFIVFVKKNFI